MARIDKLEEGSKEHLSVHDEASATYYVLRFPTGEKMLQIDSYGRSTRDFPEKVSQSIQFSPKAIKQLKEILKDF